MLKIADKVLAEDKPVFIIAEAGVNHNGSLDTARQLVDVARAAGADCVKFQTFTSEDLVTEEADQAAYQKENTGNVESQRAMLKRLELTREDHIALRDYCTEKGIIFASTPHSSTKDVDVLDSIGVPFFKIGSGDLTNLPFLSYVAKKDKPMIVSTGMANAQEIKEAYEVVVEAMCNDAVFLKCTTSYPCPIELANVQGMVTLRKELGVPVGYSDHTAGYAAAALATSLGAVVIEKHITLSRTMDGPDHKASLEPKELQLFVAIVRLIREKNIAAEQVYQEIKNMLGVILESDMQTVLGSGELVPFPVERAIAEVARKSIVASRDLDIGSVLALDDLVVKRPGTGMPPKYIFGKYNRIVGRTLCKAIKKDHLLSIEYLT